MTAKSMDQKGAGFLIDPVGAFEIFSYENFDEDARMYAKTSEDFIAKEVVPNIEAIEEQTEGLTPSLLRKAGELGLLMVDIPEKYEGLGLSKAVSMLVTERLHNMGSFSAAFGAHTGIGTLPIVYFGNDDQKARYLPLLATAEKIGAYCLTEPGAGSDALNIKTRAVLTEDGKRYTLNGTKQFITNAGFADIFTIFAKIDGEHFTGFIVEKDFPGVSIGVEEKKMGIKGSSTCSVILEDCMVPVDNLLGEQGRGHVIAFNILNIGRLKLGVGALGTCKRMMHLSAVYANERNQFNRPISKFPMIKQKLADMVIWSYALESMAYRTAGLVDAALAKVPKDDPEAEKKFFSALFEYVVEDSILKVYGSECSDFCVDQAVQIHGGYGFIQEYEVERHYRDNRVARIYEGTNEINRMLIPGMLLKRAAKGNLPLMESLPVIQAAAKDSSKLPQKGDGPLATEAWRTDLAKMGVLHACNWAIAKYGKNLSDYQVELGIMSDMMMELYAMDSALCRTLQIIEDRGEDKAAYQSACCRVLVSESIDKVQVLARQLADNISANDEINERLAELDVFFPHVSAKTIEDKMTIAEKLCEEEKYWMDFTY